MCEKTSTFDRGELGLEVEREDGQQLRQQHRAARRFVNAARLHANKAVFNQIEAPDAIVAPQRVKAREQRGRRQAFAVNGNCIAGFKADLNMGRLIRGVFGRCGALLDEFGARRGWVFQHFALA